MDKLKKMLKSNYFGVKVFEVFFTLSPTSRIKFRNIHRIAMVWTEIVKTIVLNSPRSTSKMKAAHKRVSVTKKEYKIFCQSVKCVLICYCFDHSILNFNDYISIVDEQLSQARENIYLVENKDEESESF